MTQQKKTQATFGPQPVIRFSHCCTTFSTNGVIMLYSQFKVVCSVEWNEFFSNMQVWNIRSGCRSDRRYAHYALIWPREDIATGVSFWARVVLQRQNNTVLHNFPSSLNTQKCTLFQHPLFFGQIDPRGAAASNSIHLFFSYTP